MCQQPDTADIIARGQNIVIHSVTTDLPLRMMGMMGRQRPQRLSSIHISRQKEMRTRVKT